MKKKMNNPNSHKIKRAIVSVSDKSNLVPFCTELVNLGVEIFSTGGTKKALLEANLPVKSVSDITNFPEILGGRVKTLHPMIHSGLLADLGNEEHLTQMKEHNLESIDLLVVNLYPFEKTLEKENVGHDELIENIDIGGPAMLRASAKNYKWTATIVNPAKYDEVIAILKDNNCTIPIEKRAELAGEVFATTAYYDSLIANYFESFNNTKDSPQINLSFKKEYDLRYGENPHQKAALYGNFSKIFNKIHGKELSFNNIIDINASAQLISEFTEPACTIVKHTNPCGVATGNTLSEAYNKAFATDTVSPFGGIISFNRTVDLETAQTVHSIFTEVIIAPEFTAEALELLTKKKDRRLIVCDFENIAKYNQTDIRSVVGGLLTQSANLKLVDDGALKVVTNRTPTPYEYRALMFAWLVCKHVKSNAIVYTKDDATLGIGAGQMSRVDSSRIAVEKAKMMGLNLEGSVVASDAFFPFADGLLQAVEAGATAIIQPGGSVRDEEVIKAANENNIAMIFTGMRHFRH